MASRFIIGLDIGTSTIKVALGEVRAQKLILHKVFKEPSRGLRKGTIVELAEVSQSLSRAFSEVKKVSKHGLRNIYVNIGTPQVKTQHSRGIVAVSRADAEIYEEDIHRVVRASQAVNLAPNRMVIHHIPYEYVVDGVGEIVDPLGLSGNRLEVNSLVVDAFAPHVKDIMRVVELGGGQVVGLVISPLVGARAALSRKHKELGSVLIDIGAGTTGIAVYEENRLIEVGVLPLGAANITNDIAIALKISPDAAEELKLQYGYALSSEIGSREVLELGKILPEAKGIISRRFIADVIEARLAEIFEFINNELKLVGKAGRLPGGAVLTGGGAKLPGITELVRQELKMTGQIGLAFDHELVRGDGVKSEFLEDPEFVNALGLMFWGFDEERKKSHGLLPKLTLRRFFGNLLP